ncbi:hypothetical protein YC2023_089104 [Brassica napus]
MDARSLRSDRAWLELGRYVATELCACLVAAYRSSLACPRPWREESVHGERSWSNSPTGELDGAIDPTRPEIWMVCSFQLACSDLKSSSEKEKGTKSKSVKNMQLRKTKEANQDIGAFKEGNLCNHEKFDRETTCYTFSTQPEHAANWFHTKRSNAFQPEHAAN